MSDERPETCPECNAPEAWCKCARTTNKPTGEATGLARQYIYVKRNNGKDDNDYEDGNFYYLAADVDALLEATRAAHAAAMERLKERHREYIHKSEALNLRLAAEDDETRARALAAKDAEMDALRPLANIGRLEVQYWRGKLPLVRLHKAIEAYIATSQTTAKEEPTNE